MLGGTSSQAFAIKEAKKMGHYVITCDYLPNNPGHQYGDKYYNVSTTDKIAILDLAAKLKVDGIVAYASDPAAPTAAYVCEQLGLPTSPYESVEILSKKNLFRDFLRKNNFNVPKSKGYSDPEEALSDIDMFKFPVMIKPTDSSGSKGITKLMDKTLLINSIEESLYYSREKKFIIEEFISKKGVQISGDAFSVDGKLVFHCFGNEFYSDIKEKDFVPLGECWPSFMPENVIKSLHDELQRVISLLDMKTNAYNVEAIIDQHNNVYILELGARSGGSLIPQITELATGINMVKYVIKAALGENCSDLKMVKPKGYWSNYMLHSKKRGKFVKFLFDEDFEKNNLIEIVSDIAPEDKVNSFRNAGDALGTLLIQYSSEDEMLYKIQNMDKYVHVVVH